MNLILSNLHLKVVVMSSDRWLCLFLFIRFAVLAQFYLSSRMNWINNFLLEFLFYLSYARITLRTYQASFICALSQLNWSTYSCRTHGFSFDRPCSRLFPYPLLSVCLWTESSGIHWNQMSFVLVYSVRSSFFVYV